MDFIDGIVVGIVIGAVLMALSIWVSNKFRKIC